MLNNLQTILPINQNLEYIRKCLIRANRGKRKYSKEWQPFDLSIVIDNNSLRINWAKCNYSFESVMEYFPKDFFSHLIMTPLTKPCIAHKESGYQDNRSYTNYYILNPDGTYYRTGNVCGGYIAARNGMYVNADINVSDENNYDYLYWINNYGAAWKN